MADRIHMRHRESARSRVAALDIAGPLLRPVPAGSQQNAELLLLSECKPQLGGGISLRFARRAEFISEEDERMKHSLESP